MEPLIEELMDLWKGFDALDVVSRKKIKLHYLALSTLFGRVTKGYFASVRCDKDPCSRD
jgi:hypothetical protein